MLLSFAGTVAVFVALSLGLAWPFTAKLPLPPGEKLLANVALSVFGIFLGGWLVFIARLPLPTLWMLPLLAAAGLVAGRRELARLTADREVRALLLAQALVTTWCIAWLAFVSIYSGGGWAADWYEHWERTRFFLEHAARETKFLGRYSLTARPPLANVVIGAPLALTRIDFAHYQLVSAAFASLAFLPAALLARRWGSARAIGVLAVLVMVSPLFVQNATFAWTKLPAAFFVLAGLYFFLRTRDVSAPPFLAYLSIVLLAAGILAHYSAAPYVVVLAGSWVLAGHARWREAAWRRTTVGMAAAGILVLVTWFGWSLAEYGMRDTLLTNSSVTSADVRSGNQVVKIAANLFDTIVPPFLRSFDTSLIAQRSAWGRWHDWLFQNYQVNLIFAFGSAAWLVLIRELARAAAPATPRQRMFWILFAAFVVFLGVAVHGQRDHWGLAHICLQPLVILGLAFLAARWADLPRRWRAIIVAGATVDLAFGVALHFGVQSFALERWLAPGRSLQQTFDTLSEPAQMNLLAKIEHRLVFFGDAIGAPLTLIGAVLVALLAVALWLARRRATAGDNLP